MRLGQDLVPDLRVGKLRGRFNKHGRAVLSDRRVQLHDLPVGVPVGQNQTHDDASPA